MRLLVTFDSCGCLGFQPKLRGIALPVTAVATGAMLADAGGVAPAQQQSIGAFLSFEIFFLSRAAAACRHAHLLWALQSEGPEMGRNVGFSV